MCLAGCPVGLDHNTYRTHKTKEFTVFAKKSFMWIIFLPFFLHGCGSQSLDRETARKLIIENPKIDMLKKEVPITNAAHIAGQELGWWQGKQFSKRDGKAETGIYDEIIPGQPSRTGAGFYLVRPQSQVQVKVEVDGIAMGASDGNKIIEFRWTYFGLPKFLGWVAIRGGTGKAYAQLYDDGWRIQRLFIENSADRYLSQAGAAELSRALQKARARTAALEQKEALAKKKMKERSVLSRTPTILIKEFVFHAIDPKYDLRIQVNDVGVSVNGYNFGKNYTHKQYFADVYKQAGGAVELNKHGVLTIVRYIPSFASQKQDPSEKKLALKNEIESAFVAWKSKFSDVVHGCRKIGYYLGCEQPAIK